MDIDYFLSREKAAERLCVSIRQLDRYIKEGRVKAFKPFGGRRVLIYENSLTEDNLKSPVPVFTNFEEI